MGKPNSIESAPTAAYQPSTKFRTRSLAVRILFFQIHYRVNPHALDWQAVKSVGWPYAIVAAVLSVLAMVRAPVGMDTDLRAEVESLKKQIVELTEAQRIIYDFRLHLA